MACNLKIVVNCRDRAYRECCFSALLIDVNHYSAFATHRLEDRHAHQPKASRANHEHQFVADEGPKFLQSGIGGDAGACERRGGDGIEPF